MTDDRYGLYLIPPADEASRVGAIRTVLYNQLGLEATQRFMVNATLKRLNQLGRRGKHRSQSTPEIAV